jgi:hypothetical protein
MSGKITEQSQARMDRRDEFVWLVPCNNIDVMKRGEDLPIMSLEIRGLDRHSTREVAQRIIDLLTVKLPEISVVTGPGNEVIDRDTLWIKTRMAA